MDAISSTSALAGLMPAFSAAGAHGPVPPFSLAGEGRNDLAGVRGGAPAAPVAPAREPPQTAATAPRGRENTAAERRETDASASTARPRAVDHGGRCRTPESEPPPDGSDAQRCAGPDTATGCGSAPPEELAATTTPVGEDRPPDGKILPPWLAWIAASQTLPGDETPTPAATPPAARVAPPPSSLPGTAAAPPLAAAAPGQPALPAWPAAGAPVGLPFNPLSGDAGDPPAPASVPEAAPSAVGTLLESLEGSEPPFSGRLPVAAPAGPAVAASAAVLEGLVRRLGPQSRDGSTAGPQPPPVEAGGATRPDAPPLPPPIQAAAAAAGAVAAPIAPACAQLPTDADASSPQEPAAQSVQDLRGPLTLLQSAPVAPTARPPAVINLHAPVGSEQWSQALGERVQWLADQNFTQAQIKLNPAQLGPIEIRVQVNGDQATVQFTAHNHVTRDALEQAMPRLRDMLGANGFNTVDVNVAQHSFSERPQHQQQAQRYEPLKDWLVPQDRPATGQARGWTRATTARLDAYA